MTILHMTPRPVSEVLPDLGTAGKFLAVILLFLGAGTMVYLVSMITAYVVEGHFSEIFRRRSMLKQIAKLRNHFIICGANHTAQNVISELLKREMNFVVVEPEHDTLKDSLSLGDFFYIEGDPTEDEQLIAAGIKVARGIVVALPSDETNLYITFASRELNPSIRIISRVSEAAAASRLLRAGANNVVNPDFIGGLRMVSEIIRPTVVSFLDIMMRDVESAFRIEEAEVKKGSELINRTLEQARIKEATGALALAVRKPGSSSFVYNPPGDIGLEEGTVIVVLANLQQIKKLRELTGEADSLIHPHIE